MLHNTQLESCLKMVNVHGKSISSCLCRNLCIFTVTSQLKSDGYRSKTCHNLAKMAILQDSVIKMALLQDLS